VFEATALTGMGIWRDTYFARKYDLLFPKIMQKNAKKGGSCNWIGYGAVHLEMPAWGWKLVWGGWSGDGTAI
jgi:hypothetical protein